MGFASVEGHAMSRICGACPLSPSEGERAGVRGKSEIRSSKSETNPKFKAAEMFKTPSSVRFRAFGFRVLDLFRISCFGFRISGSAGLPVLRPFQKGKSQREGLTPNFLPLPFGRGEGWGEGSPLARFLRVLSAFCLAAVSLPVLAAELTNQPTVILVIGAPGEPDFKTNFVRQAELWTTACTRRQAKLIQIGLSDGSGTPDHERLKQSLAAEPKDSFEALWLVLIGHGTYDGKEARFNLRGPDVTATELNEWLKPFHRPLVFINTASASAPFLNKLSATNRVIVTATRSGNEQNFTRFGLFFAEALIDPQSDLDKDGQISVLEAFLAASTRTAEFYRTEGRLATEHALIDDNGDGLGTPADWFRGVHPIKKPEGAALADGVRARQFCLLPGKSEQDLPAELRAKRDALELSIARLREKKSQYSEDDYYRELEKLLVELLHVYGYKL